MSDDTDEQKPSSKRQVRRILDALEISRKAPTAEDMAFLAREFILCTLPHRNPGDVPAWSRTNGHLTLSIRPGWNSKKKEVYGYPYGTIPRLLLAWVTTEAIRTKSRRLELGRSLSEFMAILGLSSYTGRGPRGDAKRLREQMDRLFQAVISFEYSAKGEARSGHAWLNMQVAPKGVFWWSEKDPDQGTLWGSWIELSDSFYQAITSEPVPLDVRILKHIKQSPLALDLYVILNREAFRAQKNDEPRFLAWEWLYLQIGNEYGTLHDFRRYALPQLKAIIDVHSGLIISQQKGRKGQQSGLVVSNLSTPSIPPGLVMSSPVLDKTALPLPAPPPMALVPSPPRPPERHLKPSTVETFRELYRPFDPYECKGDFDAWQAKLPPERHARHYDRAFLAFAAKWFKGQV
jgi:hypothetical protein